MAAHRFLRDFCFLGRRAVGWAAESASGSNSSSSSVIVIVIKVVVEEIEEVSSPGIGNGNRDGPSANAGSRIGFLAHLVEQGQRVLDLRKQLGFLGLGRCLRQLEGCLQVLSRLRASKLKGPFPISRSPARKFRRARSRDGASIPSLTSFSSSCDLVFERGRGTRRPARCRRGGISSRVVRLQVGDELLDVAGPARVFDFGAT